MIIEIKDELYDFYTVPYGYILKLKSQSDKKNNNIDITTKDYRSFKFRFENPYSYQRTVDLVMELSQIKKHKNFFSYDYA